jgi:penicillin amidase
LAELLGGEAPIDVERIFSLQRDVRVRSSTTLRDLVLDKVREANIAVSLGRGSRAALAAISRWDGSYAERSEGALAFEVCRAALVTKLCGPELVGSDWAAYASIDAVENWLMESIAHASAAQLKKPLAAGIEAAATALRTLGNWGGVHRLRLSHPFGLVPLIGRSFRYTDLPASGSSESLLKTAHGLVRGRHDVMFGSNARHVFDLSDPDENYFVLLGGQDGWIGSTTFLDQLALWRSGRYVKVPLGLEAVRRNAAVRVELTP